jgi:hypothetical protein
MYMQAFQSPTCLLGERRTRKHLDLHIKLRVYAGFSGQVVIVACMHRASHEARGTWRPRDADAVLDLTTMDSSNSDSDEASRPGQHPSQDAHLRHPKVFGRII